MNLIYTLNPKDERLRRISREDYDCFVFDVFTITALDRLVKGEIVSIEDLIATLVDGGKNFNEYLVKARSIRNLVANNPYSSTYLVYQTVTDRRSKEKRPFLLIPVVLIDKGMRLQRNGDLILNPIISEQFRSLSLTSIVPTPIKEVRSVDTKEIQDALEALEYRMVFELVLAHFKIQYPEHKGIQKPVFQALQTSKNKTQMYPLSLPYEEKTAIIQHVLDGKNLYIKASYQHAIEPVVVDMMTQLALQKKQVLYFSQYDSSLVRDALVQAGLDDAVYHLVEPLDTAIEPPEMTLNLTQIKDLEHQLIAYQNHMRHTEVGISYHQVLRQLIKLSTKPLHAIPIDAFETLSHTDYVAISRLLDECEALMKKLGIENPSDCHWNAVSIRDVRNREREFHLQLGSFLAVLNDTKSILNDLQTNHGFVLPRNIPALEDDLEETSYLNTVKYPTSWFEPGVFAAVEATLQDQSDLMVRLNALVHTLTGNYKKEALDKQLPELFAAMYHDMFAKDDAAVDDLISRRQELLTKLSTLKRVWLDIQSSIQEFEVVYRTQVGKGFLEFVTLNNRLLLDPTFDRQWLTVDPNKLELLQQQMKYRQGLINQYLKQLQELSKYIHPKALELDPQILEQYQARLGKRFGIKPEQKSAERLVDPFVTPAFHSLPTKLQQDMVSTALQLQQSAVELQDIVNLLKTTIKSEVTISSIHEYQTIISMVLSNRDHYNLQTLDQYRLNKVKILDGSFQSNMALLRSLLQDPVFSTFYDETPSVVTERITSFASFFHSFNQSFDVFMALQLQAGKRPSSTTMQGVVGIIERIRKTNETISAMEPDMKHYYQANYNRELTNFSAIKQLKVDFATMLSHFTSFEAMNQEARRDNYVFIKDQLRVLQSNVKNYKKQLPALNNNFVVQDFSDELGELIQTITPFYQPEELMQWINLSDSIQSLRGYKQSRLAAQLNTGIYTRSLKRSFQYEYLKRLLELFQTPPNIAATKEAYATYHNWMKQSVVYHRFYLSNKIKKQRITISNLQTLSLIDKKKFDVVIVDGIERFPEALLVPFTTMASQQVYLEDASVSPLLGMVNKPRQGIYPPLNEVTWMNVQPRTNCRVATFDVPGVIQPHSITKHQTFAVVETIIQRLLQTQGYISVVLFKHDQRNQMFESIQQQLITLDHPMSGSMLKRVRIVVDPEYVLPSETIILFWDRYVTIDKLERYLPMSKELIIVNEDGSLEDVDIERYVRSDIQYYPELKDEVLVWLVSQLPQEYTYRQAMKPYDIVVSKQGQVDLLLHVMINDAEQMNILDEAILLHDDTYAGVKKLFVGLHELYPITQVDFIANKVKELLS
jgi:hypothetical protein